MRPSGMSHHLNALETVFRQQDSEIAEQHVIDVLSASRSSAAENKQGIDVWIGATGYDVKTVKAGYRAVLGRAMEIPPSPVDAIVVEVDDLGPPRIIGRLARHLWKLGPSPVPPHPMRRWAWRDEIAPSAEWTRLEAAYNAARARGTDEATRAPARATTKSPVGTPLGADRFCPSCEGHHPVGTTCVIGPVKQRGANRTDGDRAWDRTYKRRQRERAKHRPDPLFEPDTPPPGRVPAGLGKHRAVGRGSYVKPDTTPPPQSGPGLFDDE